MHTQELTKNILSAEALALHPSLTLFQKVLLTTDGTLTSLLALYTGEEIKARKLEQSFITGFQAPRLECPKDATVLHRKIMLSGRQSERDYLFADSYFMFENFSHEIQTGLLHSEQPIGLLWRKARLEMYREIVERKIENCPSTSVYFGLPEETPFLSRTYVIFHNGLQLGVITEKFPAHLIC